MQLVAGAHVNKIKRKPGDLLQLLKDLEAAGLRMVSDAGFGGDPFAARLVALQVESAHAYPARNVPAGTVRVLAGTYPGGGWRAPNVDQWLTEKLDRAVSGDRADKLRGGPATERHLVIVLDSLSVAGAGISGMLNDYNKPGVAGELLPTFVPPHPVTHMWIFVSSANAYLRWAKHEGWTIVG